MSFSEQPVSRTAVAGQPGAHGVGDLRAVALDPGVLALGPPADDHVETLGLLGEQGGDVRRVVLEVRVQGDHKGPPGFLEAFGKGGGLPGVGFEGQVAHLGVGLGQLADEGQAAIRAAIVDEEDFEGGGKDGARRPAPGP